MLQQRFTQLIRGLHCEGSYDTALPMKRRGKMCCWRQDVRRGQGTGTVVSTRGNCQSSWQTKTRTQRMKVRSRAGPACTRPSIQRPTPVVARAALVRGALLGRAQLDKFVRWLRHLTSSGFVRWLRHRGDTAAIRSEAIMTTVGLKISLFHFMYVLIKYLLVGTGIEL